MKKFLNLVCDVCKRSTDQIVNNAHYATDKCTITYGCTGRLLPVQYRSNREIQPAPAVGIEDWRPRGSKIDSDIPNEQEILIGLATGVKNQLTLAVQYTPDILNSDYIVLKLSAQGAEHKSFRQYSFYFETSISTISGVEIGLEQKVLRYSQDDNVEVFINGVEIERGTDHNKFQINDGKPGSDVPPNTIKFNNDFVFSGGAQVNIIVSKRTNVTTYDLVFTKNHNNESRNISSAWDNIKFVEFFNSTSELAAAQGYKSYYLFHCDIAVDSLPLNNIFIIQQAKILNGEEINLDRCKFLLARKPYSILDRYMNIFIPLDGLSIERDYLKFTLINKMPTLQITKTSIETCFPPFKIPVESKFRLEKNIGKQLTGISDQLTIDGAVIIGPDA